MTAPTTMTATATTATTTTTMTPTTVPPLTQLPPPATKQPLITKRITKLEPQTLITKNPFFKLKVSVGTGMNDTPRPPRDEAPLVVNGTNVQIPVPTKSATDNIPLNFYTVFGDGSSRMSDYFKTYNRPPDAHKVPNLHPIPVHPPPPVE